MQVRSQSTLKEPPPSSASQIKDDSGQPTNLGLKTISNGKSHSLPSKNFCVEAHFQLS